MEKENLRCQQSLPFFPLFPKCLFIPIQSTDGNINGTNALETILIHSTLAFLFDDLFIFVLLHFTKFLEKLVVIVLALGECKIQTFSCIVSQRIIYCIMAEIEKVL